LKKPIEDPMEASGVNLSNGGRFKELRQVKEHLSDHQIIVFDVLNPDRIMFSGNQLSTKKLHLISDWANEHYNAITTLRKLWRNSTYVKDVTLYMNLSTNVTKFVPCVPLHHPVLRIRASNVVHATDKFSLRSIFRII
jgi:hypothetical protein